MSINLWGNKFIAIDTETTGLDPDFHEITQIAAVALLDDFTIDPTQQMFNIEIRPENLDAINLKALSKSHKTLEGLLLTGLDRDTARRLFLDWLDQVVLHVGKKAIPVAFNWAFDRDFLITFLGRQSFENCFHPRARDGMAMLTYVADRIETFEYRLGFSRFTLEKCCEMLSVDNALAHDALHDAIATAECVKRLLTISLPVLPKTEEQEKAKLDK